MSVIERLSARGRVHYGRFHCTYTHTRTGELLKYDNGWWGEVAPGDRLKLTKTEVQVGLSLFLFVRY